MTMNTEQNLHYSADYFQWQSQIGTFGGTANKIKFEKFIKPTDFVIDFGAGGGFLIEQIQCQKKLGVEINPSARANAEKRGVPMTSELSQIESGTVDVAISNHALEHTDSPLDILKQVHRVLKPGGKAVFVVPCEAISYAYAPKDINFHLYTWSPMCIGNLFTRAGFEVVESAAFMHQWPPFFYRIQKLVGWNLFHLICRVYSHIDRKLFQVRCVAVKK
jgi:SAM-dependent methyltransferase